MGFLDGLFGGGKKEVRISELDAWLDCEITAEQEILVAESRPLVQEVLDVREGMLGLVSEIQKSPSDGLPGRIQAIVRTSKPGYASSMADVLNGIQADGRLDYAGVLRFKSILSASLEKMARIMFSHGRYLPLAYGDKLSEVQKGMKRLIDAGKAVGEKTASRVRLPGLEKIRAVKRTLDGRSSGRDALSARIAAIQKDVSGMDESLAGYERERKELLADRRISDLRNERDEIDKKKKDLKALVHHHLAPVSRPLRKYQKMAVQEGRLTPEAEKSLNGFLENPVEHFLSGVTIEPILSDLEKVLQEGRLDVKNPEKALKNVADTRMFLSKTLVEEYNHLAVRGRQTEDEIGRSDTLQKISEVELSIEQLKAKASAAKDELKSLEKKAVELDGNIDEAVRQLTEGLSGFNVSLVLG